MYRRDYIIRLIERFGRALLMLRDRILKRQVQFADVRAEIHEVAREAGLDIDVARQLDAGMLLMWLSPTGEIDEPRFWLLAELLFLEGLASHEAGSGDGGHGDLARALAIYAKIAPSWRPNDQLASAGERCLEIQAILDSGR